MIRVALVATFPDMAERAQTTVSYWKKQGVEVSVYCAKGKDNAEQTAQKIKADAVVSRGITGSVVKKQLASSIPYVELKTSGYDIIEAIHACKKDYPQAGCVGVIGTHAMIYGSQRIADILRVKIISYLISNDFEARKQLEKSRLDGVDMIIGGSVVVEMAEREHIVAELIRASDYSIESAIAEAASLAQVALNERTEFIRMQTCLDALREGIITVNDQGMITNCNAAAWRFLGTGKEKNITYTGKPLYDVIPQIGTDKRKKNMDDCVILRKGKTTLAANIFPVMVGTKNKGTVITLQDISIVQELEEQIRNSMHKKGNIARYSFGDCLGGSAVFVESLEMAYRFSKTDSSVLLYGETGTGKELFAQSIHTASSRKKGPFVAVNCATLTENLLESALFGYVDGAFTGATKGGKAGLFELAHGGTIFLDEVSEIPLQLQAKLLRVLQEKEVRRLGHDRVIPVDVRVISATNLKLPELVKKKQFRGDLLYRLDVLELVIPPLRERREDIRLLAEKFLNKNNEHEQNKVTLSESAQRLLEQYSWPGNIRELQNICDRLSVIAGSSRITGQDIKKVSNLSFEVEPTAFTSTTLSSVMPVRQMTRSAAMAALKTYGGNKTKAAEALGISRSTLWRILSTHDNYPGMN